jgi:phosphoglycerate dehydrogenase-like enzyme
MSSLVITSRSFSKHCKLRQEVLARYPDAKFNDDGLNLSGKSLIQFMQGYEKAITALEIINESILTKLPDLKVIGKYGVGLDMINLHEMKKCGVQLGWTGGVNKRSVSELVISSSISLLHRSIFANSEVKKGEWYQIKGRQLSNCTIGIVGCGHIGKDLVKLLQPFNCKILSHDILDFKEFYQKYGVKPVSLDELVHQADVVTLHLPLNDSTKYIINNKRLNLLKKDAILINFARGGLIDESELKKLLLENKIAGAAVDVFEVEPPTDQDFLTMDNVLVTPHIGGSTEEAILAMGMAAIEGLENAKDPMEYL